ncbi:cation-independent mannose-6-phosphate receptor [Pseudomyrmex gracilis]|uniref:cation-independent mannose-6-phosphate receptor n=1 Tax=Pseudomyrmex gracilis TaxID=219809 RepID=UPI0009956D5F|nr:cation-independent mannose-6-phosphate receptor [Pseudomyrmex gracilis]XP_020283028.1 cation-independent mannose-6-phosphate receptor [Pseudomyrmex gracilis]
MSKSNKLIFLFYISTVIFTTALTADSSLSICEVPDKTLSIVYNLTRLSSNKEDIVIKPDFRNDSIRMQLCTPLIKKCNNQDGYAICVVTNNTERGIGKFPPLVTTENGRPSFTFTGGACTFERNSRVVISIMCDYSAGIGQPKLVTPRKGEICDVFMVWRTSLICGPRKQVNCTVVENGQLYDLSPLTRFSENYVIHVRPDITSPLIELNVCHSVIPRQGSTCFRSGACMTRGSEEHTNLDLGEVEDGPFFGDGRNLIVGYPRFMSVLKNGHNLMIEYPNGALCTQRNITTPHVKTTIIFICNLEATETIPQYVGGKESCHYKIIWTTAAACSVQSLRDYSAKKSGKCVVINPITNFTYNLSSLINEVFTVTNANGVQYKFSVCGNLPDDVCGIRTGACKLTNRSSLGQANTNLMWQQGGPYLNYSDGSLCENGMRHHTIIGFFCGPEGSFKHPLLMEDYPCQTVIHWDTRLVCEKRIKCATNNYDEISLTPLIRSIDNYVVKANGSEFHINICRPLVPKRGLTCAHGSAACKVSVNSNKEYVNEISLGFPEDSPTLNRDFQTVLRYTGGSKCSENPTQLISSNFTFVCDNNNQELPIFKQYIDCTYVFEWRTSIACGAVMGSWTSPCTIKDGFLSDEYDLSLLYNEQQIYYVEGKQGKRYGISICGGDKYCNGSAVCHEGNGYGSLSNVIFDYSRDDAKLKYSNGSKCNNNSYTSEVRFICNESISIGAPKLQLESQCSAEFEWHTEVVCAKHASSQSASSQAEASSEEDFFDELSPRNLGTIAAVSTLVIIIIVLIIALIHFRNAEKSWFSFRRNVGRVQYCRVDTNEEARLLLDAIDSTQCVSDSDDDLLHI